LIKSVVVVTGLTISIDDVVGLVIPIPILVALTVVIAPVPDTVNIFVVPFHVNSGSSVIADVPLPINNRPAVKVLAPVPPRDTLNVPALALPTFKFVSLDPSPEKLVAVNILVAVVHVKFPDCVIAAVPPINNLSTTNELTPLPPKLMSNIPLRKLSAFNDVKPLPEPTNFPFKVSVVGSHVNKEVVNIDDVLLPIKILFNGKVLAPVPPRATVNVPDEILEELRLLKLAPDPENKLEVIVPVAFMFVVCIPPSAFIIPLKDVAIALLYA
jgi:hypothetical protein